MPRVRFGLFEFDADTRELRREGAPVRLQAQPAQVLAMLLAQPGQLVTREALREAVWGKETFVDFDRGLNFCVSQIRGALGDSADSPRFIRTTPKRGYQFIAPVALFDDGSGPPIAPAPRAPRRSAVAWVAALIAVLAAGCFWISSRKAPRVTVLPLIVAVARFDNQTGNPALDRFTDGLTDSVVAELTSDAGSRYGVIGNAAILRQPRDRRDLNAISSTLKARFVVLGQVQRNDSHFRILAHLIRLPEQTHVTVTRIERSLDDPLTAQSELARRIATDFSQRVTSPALSSAPHISR